jgi:hypothetical protein
MCSSRDFIHLVIAGLAAFAKASAAEPIRGPAKPWRRRDPAIHRLKRVFLMDARVKPAHDE